MSAAPHPPRPIFTAVAAGGSLTAAVLVAGVVAVAAIGTPPALPAFLGGGDMTVRLAAGGGERPAVSAGGVRVPLAGGELARPERGFPLANSHRDVPAREARAGRRPATTLHGARHVRTGARTRSTTSTPGNTTAPVVATPLATPAAGAPAPAGSAAPAAATAESIVRARSETNPGRRNHATRARPQSSGGDRGAGAPVTTPAAPAGPAGADSAKPAGHAHRADRVPRHDDAPDPRPRRIPAARPHDQPAPAASAPPHQAAAAPQAHGPGEFGGQASGDGHDRGGPANGRAR
jgi:hypothetical protein